MGRRRFALVALCALVVIAGGWALVRANSPNPGTTAVGVPTCALANLPAEVADTVPPDYLLGDRPLYEAAAQFTLDSSQLAHDVAANALIAEARHAFSW